MWTTQKTKNIREWNKNNRNNFKMDEDAGMCCPGFPMEWLPNENRYTNPHDCYFTAKFTNNTTEYITYIVVNIKFFNKTTNTLVVQKKETFSVSLMPTITQNIQIYFENNLFKKAYKQLGDKFSWNYELIGCVPKDLAYYTYPQEYNWLE